MVALARAVAAFALLTVCMPAARIEDGSNPTAKVIELLQSLQAKITAEAQEAAKINAEAVDFCGDHAQALNHQIKDHTAEVERLKARVEEGQAVIDAMSAKIEEVGGVISAKEAEHQEREGVRVADLGSFEKEDKELIDVIDALQRASSILKRGAKDVALLQGQQVTSVTNALGLLVEASVLRAQDAAKLTSLTQTASCAKESEAEDDLGAPSSTVFQHSSSSIMEMLERLQTQAQEQLAEARKQEQVAAHSHAMVKQSLEDQIANANAEMASAKKRKVETEGTVAADHGDLTVASNALAATKRELAEHESDCRAMMADYAETKKSRTEELKALAEATKILADNTKAATSITYSAPAFLQEGQKSSGYQVIKFLRALARKQHSTALQQLETRVSLALHSSHMQGADPFEKVRGLIADLIKRLTEEAAREQSEKEWCDKELHKTAAEKAKIDAEFEKWQTKLDKTEARIGELSKDISALQASLQDLAEAQKNQDKMRAEQKALFTQSDADMTQGLAAVQMALKVLREYYGRGETGGSHVAATGASTGIIGMLEVMEADMARTQAEMQADEADLIQNYVKTTQENDVARTGMQQDVKYKTKERAELESTRAVVRGDLETVQDERSANLEYFGELQEKCVKQPETYESKKARREAEIEGLKQALAILEARGE